MFFPILFYILLLFTFGRLAIVLALLSLPFLLQKDIFEKKSSKVIFLVLSSAILFGIFFVSSRVDSCKMTELKQQLCKPISKEIRPEYFKQSLSSFLDYPLFGYGPGTFSLITRRYSLIGQHGSIFAHNFFLQTFSESGLGSGVVILFLFALILSQAMKVIKSNTSRSIEYYLAISFVLLFINSLLDFDWNTFFIFQLSLLFAAGFLQKPNLENKRLIKLQSLFWVLSAFIIVILGLVVVLTKFLLADSQVNLLVRIFPYSRYQAKEIVSSKELNKTSFSRMIKIHSYDSDILYLFLEKTIEPSGKIALYSKLIEISPWVTSDTEYMKLLESEGMYRELGIVAVNGLKIISQAQEKGYAFRHETKEEIAQYLIKVADYHLGIGDPKTAAEYYKSVLQIEKWTFHLSEPYFINQESITIKDVGVLLRLTELKPPLFGKNHEKFILWLESRIVTDALFFKADDIQVYLNFLSEDQLWHIVSSKIFYHMQTLSHENGRPYLLWWYDFWYDYILLAEKPSAIEKEYQYRLMNTLFARGEDEKARVIQEFIYHGKLPKD